MSSEVKCPLSKIPRLSEEHGNNLLLHNSCLPNPHLDKLDSDLLYHLGYEKKECSEKFSDVKVSYIYILYPTCTMRVEQYGLCLC